MTAVASTPIVDRIALGTVQLGLPYGRRRGSSLLSVDETMTILETAWELGVRVFDTAEAYGLAAERLALWLRQGPRPGVMVVTKVKAEGPPLGSAMAAAVARFEGLAAVTLLTHGAVDEALWAALRSAAAPLEIALGQSVYTSAEVREAVRLDGLGRLQVPGSIFDLRAVEARADAPTPLDVRSVYLQGVLLDPPAVAERRAPGAGILAGAVQSAARDSGWDPAQLLLAAMHSHLRPLDRLVVGVDSADELRALTVADAIPRHDARRLAEAIRREVGPVHASTLDPRTW